MAIPKEPRQLMINLMYLVLTALLALNVSAEVINAFFMIHDGIQNTNTILGEANTQVISSMDATIEKKGEQYRPLHDKANRAKEITDEFIAYIDDIRNQLTEESGGAYPADYEDPKKAGRPKGYKNKDVPQRFFVENKKGEELRQRIADTRSKLVELLREVKELNIEGTNITEEKIAAVEKELALSIDEKTWKEMGKESWEAYIFGYMPIAACYPLLSKFQNDARTSSASIVSFLAKQIGATDIKFDTFEPVASAKKNYLLKGEKFEAEVFLGAFSKQASIGVSVNGSSLPVKNGKATYTAQATGVGEKKYSVSISIKNPSTGKTDVYKKDFFYEVGAPSVTVSADKMNVFYIGVDNPVTIAASGISSNQLRVNASGVSLKRRPGGTSSQYVTKPTKPGTATITVSGGALKATPFKFRVKRIPDPVVRLGNIKEGRIGNGTMKAQRGLIPWLENFDFEAKCKIQSYNMFYIPKRQDAVLIKGTGGSFSGRVLQAVQAAKPGDSYQFTDVKARCPGDPAARKVNSVSVVIK